MVNIFTDEYAVKYESLCRFIGFYQSLRGNETGGNFHIVLDDGNLADSYISFCIGEAEYHHDHLGVALGRMLLAVTEAEREAVIAAAGR